MKEVIDTEPGVREGSVKRKDVLKGSATVLFSTFAAAGAVEAVPLPASAQHVIGMAFMKANFLKSVPFVKRQTALPATENLSGMAVLIIDQDLKDNVANYLQEALRRTELNWVNNANEPQPTHVYQIDLPNASSTNYQNAVQSFGADGQLFRAAVDSQGTASSGQRLYNKDRQTAGKPPNAYVFVLIWA